MCQISQKCTSHWSQTVSLRESVPASPWFYGNTAGTPGGSSLAKLVTLIFIHLSHQGGNDVSLLNISYITALSLTSTVSLCLWDNLCVWLSSKHLMTTHCNTCLVWKTNNFFFSPNNTKIKMDIFWKKYITTLCCRETTFYKTVYIINDIFYQ